MPDSHTSLSTPNPMERSLLVLVEESVYAQNPDIIPIQGTRYGDFPKEIFAQDYRQEYENYIYTEQNGTHGLLFAKNKTREEANTPFRKTTWKGNHRWPPILLEVNVIPDYSSPRSFAVISGTNIGTGIGPTYYDQVRYISDASEGTRFLKEEFLSPTQYDIPQSPVPVATGVSYLLPGGASGNFQECLHDDILIPAIVTGTVQVIAGVNSQIGSVIQEQFFPATNFPTWGPYVLSDTQELVNGVWYRTRIRVFPPPQPDPVVRV